MSNADASSTVLAAIQAVELRAPGSLSWFGVPLQIHWPREAWNREIQQAYLSRLLYQQFYCYGHPVPLRSEPHPRVTLNEATADRLVAAHGTRFRWENGWTLRSVCDGVAHIERAGLRALAHPGQWRSAEPKGVGVSEVEVRSPAVSFCLSPGFCMVTAGRPFANSDVIRVYWNVKADAAHSLVSGLSAALGNRGISYRFKVLTNPAFVSRADSCVLYLRQQDFTRVAEELDRIYSGVAQHAREGVPAWTLKLAKGLAVAEQPPTGESFGQHRCRLLAEGLSLASEAGLTRAEDRLPSVQAHFANLGFSLAEPHKNPSSTVDYAVDIQPSVCAVQPPKATAFLEVARSIGDRLVREALWHENRCTWLGNIAGHRQVFGTIGPDLYNGTGGIAWFLAELYGATGQGSYSRTAEGAVLQSFESAARTSLKFGIGLYDGWCGVAYSLARCASLLHAPELRRHAGLVIERLRSFQGPSRIPDILSGEAGAVLCFLSLGEEALAHHCGLRLVNACRRTRDTCSWRTTGKVSHPHLTGFAHGTAGMAFSLACLYEATRDVAFAEAAMGAIRYERKQFDPSLGNWADFRGARNRREPRQYARAWCHGAPGIALSRQRCASAFASEREILLAERDVALKVTRAALLDCLDKTADLSLCHGLSGYAEILALIGPKEDRDWINKVAQLGIERLETEEPTFVGLMTGLAGIGQFYLRLHDETVPSPLWFGSDCARNNWAARPR